MVSSYISPKVTNKKKSDIAGRGLSAVEAIEKDEIVAIKGGHIVHESEFEKLQDSGSADLQIADQFYLAPRTKEEYESVMIYINHSCEPNVGFMGNIIFVAMRDIKVGEELTIDYAMFDSYPNDMKCNCGSKNCRKTITEEDWKKKELQERYGNYFSSYLLEKIRDK